MLPNSAPRSLAEPSSIYQTSPALPFNYTNPLITCTSSLLHAHPLAVFPGCLLAFTSVFGNLFLIALVFYSPQTLVLFQLFTHIFVPFDVSTMEFETPGSCVLTALNTFGWGTHRTARYCIGNSFPTTLVCMYVIRN